MKKQSIQEMIQTWSSISLVDMLPRNIAIAVNYKAHHIDTQRYINDSKHTHRHSVRSGLDADQRRPSCSSGQTFDWWAQPRRWCCIATHRAPWAAQSPQWRSGGAGTESNSPPSCANHCSTGRGSADCTSHPTSLATPTRHTYVSISSHINIG